MVTKKAEPKEEFISKKELDSLKDDLTKTVSGEIKQYLVQWFSRTNVQEVVNDAIKQGRPVKLDELGEQKPIELVSARDLIDAQTSKIS